jgi:hypothetical protein
MKSRRFYNPQSINRPDSLAKQNQIHHTYILSFKNHVKALILMITLARLPGAVPTKLLERVYINHTAHRPTEVDNTTCMSWEHPGNENGKYESSEAMAFNDVNQSWRMNNSLTAQKEKELTEKQGL